MKHKYYRYRVEWITNYGIDGMFFVTKYKILAYLLYFLLMRLNEHDSHYILIGDYWGENFVDVSFSEILKEK